MDECKCTRFQFKIVGIFLPVWLFVAAGYEHAIVNMFTVQTGMILGANLSVGRYFWNVLTPVTLGNIIGGGLFVGVIYWYLHLMKPIDSGDESSASPQSYQPAKQRNEAARPQQA